MGSQKTEQIQRTRLNNLWSPIFPHIKCEHLVLWNQNWTFYSRYSFKCAKQRRKSLSHWLCSCFSSPWHSWPLSLHEHTARLYQVVLPFLHNCSLSGWCPAYTLGLLHSRWRTLHCLGQISPHFFQAIFSSLLSWQSVAAWPPQSSSCSHQLSVNIDTEILRVPSFTKFEF